MTESAVCGVCGEPMPEGETMFKYHGYSGPCPKPPLPKQPDPPDAKDAEIERLFGILTQVASDSRTWQLHERTKELLRPFVIEHLDGLQNQ